MTAREFCERFGLRLPIVAAPMAGACPPALAVAVAEAGGMGAAGVVLDAPERIAGWMDEFRAGSAGAVQLNIWIPDRPDPDPARVDAAAAFLGRFGPPGAPGAAAPDFAEQCTAMLAARPTVVSSIMGLFDPAYVRQLHDAGIAWFACATTLSEALAAQEAGADAVVAQGMEAGGHRGVFDPESAERTEVGLFALLPRLADHLTVPIVAAGGDRRRSRCGGGAGAGGERGADRDGAAAHARGRDQPGMGRIAGRPGARVHRHHPRLLRSPRPGRPTAYVTAWRAADAPPPAPYPEQRALVGQWRAGGAIDRVNHWAGQSAALAAAEPAGTIVERVWSEACRILPT